ncbi:methyltransferase domain-containing protein [Streptomyces sp. NRRL S-448]|uniref:methyltransferase domain-containing protein n=1 Tax=Streptomyces sp. NRRL S-448 TaxID=1463907 RepID=UPI003562F7B5
MFGAEILLREGPILNVGAGNSPFGRARLDVVRVDPAYSGEPPAGEGAVAALGQALPFRDRTFSVVLGSFVAQHVRDVEELVSELLRMVRPAGVLALHPAWRPSVGRRDTSALGPYAHLFTGAEDPAAGGPQDSMDPRRTPLWTLPTLVVHRPATGTPRELDHVARVIGRSAMLVPPAVIALPARWGMQALVRVSSPRRSVEALRPVRPANELVHGWR